jgi:hypothetical protein
MKKRFKITVPTTYLEHYVVEAENENEAKDMLYFSDPEDRAQYMEDRVHFFDDDLVRWTAEEL